MTINYITIDQLKEINRSVLTNGELSGFLIKGVEYHLEAVKDLYNSLPEISAIISKAAYLWYQIASHQYFISGNKRTSSVTALKFLKINKVEVTINTEKKKSISIEIGKNSVKLDEVKNYLLNPDQ